MSTQETPWTPAPWEYVPSNENHGAYVAAWFGGDIADCYAMSRQHNRSVANGGESRPIPFQHERMDANARLISKAPEMAEDERTFVSLRDEYARGAITQTRFMLDASYIIDRMEKRLAFIKGESA